MGHYLGLLHPFEQGDAAEALSLGPTRDLKLWIARGLGSTSLDERSPGQ